MYGLLIGSPKYCMIARKIYPLIRMKGATEYGATAAGWQSSRYPVAIDGAAVAVFGLQPGRCTLDVLGLCFTFVM